MSFKIKKMDKMDKIKKQMNFHDLEDELKYISGLIFSDNQCKNQLKHYPIEDQIENFNTYEIFPHPIFKVNELPYENKAFEWFYGKDKNFLQIPTFVGRFKELIYKIRPQMILEDTEGNEINIILDMDEEFENLQQWLLDMKYEIGNFVFVYDAFKVELQEKKYYIVVESFGRMNNEKWICRLKPKRGASAKYVPKILFALIMLLICWNYDLR